jgi:hypothetical protein
LAGKNGHATILKLQIQFSFQGQASHIPRTTGPIAVVMQVAGPFRPIQTDQFFGRYFFYVNVEV